MISDKFCCKKECRYFKAKENLLPNEQDGKHDVDMVGIDHNNLL